MTTFSPAPKPAPTPKAPKGLRAANKARQKESDARAYGPPARRKLCTLGPCSACGSTELCDNAHVIEHEDGSEKGAGYKGSAKEIAPLCRPRLSESEMYEGCHMALHRDPTGFKARFPQWNPRRAARDFQRKWMAFLKGESNGK